MDGKRLSLRVILLLIIVTLIALVGYNLWGAAFDRAWNRPDFNRVDKGALLFGEIRQNETISSNFDVDVYHFEGQAGQIINIHVKPLQDNRMSVTLYSVHLEENNITRVFLYISPSRGAIINETVTLPRDGDYELTISLAATDPDDTGSYDLKVDSP